MKTALITGASSGIGADLCKAYLDKGWKVYGLSRRSPDVQHKNFVWLSCDLGSGSAIAEKVVVDESALDLLVCNAGVAFKELACSISQMSYEKMFGINVLAPMLLVNSLKAKLNQATIINISSVSDRLVEVDFALYCSSKAASTRYFEAVALELKQATIVSLLPDYIDTPMLRKLVGSDDFDWAQTLGVEDMTKLVTAISDKTLDIPSGANIIVINDQMLADLKNREQLYSYNASSGQLTLLP